MRRLPYQCLPLMSLLCLVGCGFAPGEPAAPSGSAGSGASNGVGSGGVSGIGNASGQGLSGGGGDVGPMTTGGGGTSCGQTNVSITPLPPDILIVEDRSGSMNDDDNDKTCNGGCGANSKWAHVTTAINQVLGQTDTIVNWGLKFFADADNNCGVNANSVEVAVKTMNSGPIATAFAGSTSANGGVNNGSHTPTAQAENAGVNYLKTLTDPNPKFILLATDGLPNCVQGNDNADNSTATEQAVADALTANFPTFVVGVATSADAMATATLNAMAVNGGEAQTGGATSYYNVSDTASLEAALNKIVGIVASCTIPLTGAPTNLSNVAISATDSTGARIQIPKDATNGWSYDATMTNVVLNGTSCSSLKDGTYTDFNFIYACDGVTICIDNCPAH